MSILNREEDGMILHLKSLLVFTIIFLAACSQSNKISIPVERKEHGFINYETVEAEKAIQEMPFHFQLPESIPFQAGVEEGTIFESINDPFHKGITLRYFPKGSNVDLERKGPIIGPQEFLEYRVTNFEFNFGHIKKNEKFDKLVVEGREVYYSYSKEIPSVVVTWTEEGKEYFLSYVKSKSEYSTKELTMKNRIINVYKTLVD
ncbi:hypothetical protein LCL89_02555 [Halobacillus yeomjeoni]|uniref:hypothetical protein n=1 Tax=Halobacillus yeomjeoni TaxID=311194 RepID=UPI001CD4DE22|nr:hypothetical protein [Halobacillus yeomjeoni]MCA0982922.1 hypothetical protein [Halobacillus yeomjeoni]